MSTKLPTMKVSMIALVGALSILPSFAFAADLRDVVHDRRGNVVTNRWGNCVRTKWVGSADECGPAMAAAAPAAVRERHVIGQEERTVYFPFDKSLLTADSKARLDNLSATIKNDDQVKQARIVGYADRIGSKAYNQKLSERRADAVRSYLESRGVITSHVTETRWLGEDAPVTSCPDTLKRPDLIACLQKDRRVEVEIDYVPQNTAPATMAPAVEGTKPQQN